MQHPESKEPNRAPDGRIRFGGAKDPLPTATSQPTRATLYDPPTGHQAMTRVAPRPLAEGPTQVTVTSMPGGRDQVSFQGMRTVEALLRSRGMTFSDFDVLVNDQLVGPDLQLHHGDNIVIARRVRGN